MRTVLVISEVALACVLLVGAGLLLCSFLRVLDVDLGFEPSRAAAISVDYADGRSPDERAAIWQIASSGIRRSEPNDPGHNEGRHPDMPRRRHGATSPA